MKQYLDEEKVVNNLDLACGTGRFIKYANYGLDMSDKMLGIAKKKFPNKKFDVGDAEHLPYANDSFENVISFHLFMHLDMNVTEKIIAEVGRVTKKMGLFIFDIPSSKRRKLTRYKSPTWHGGNQIDLKQLRAIADKYWDVEGYYGIAFFPIHRIPSVLRKFFILIDNALCRSFLKGYSSHLVFVLKRKA